MADLHRDERDRRDMCVTCAGQHDRDERDTPLGGVTIVTLAKATANLVPMPPFASGAVTAHPTVPFSLPKKSGEGC